jgi:hypothetical protein
MGSWSEGSAIAFTRFEARVGPAYGKLATDALDDRESGKMKALMKADTSLYRLAPGRKLLAIAPMMDWTSA